LHPPAVPGVYFGMADGEKTPGLGVERLRLRAAECETMGLRLREMADRADEAQRREYLDLAAQWDRMAAQLTAIARDIR
jgi:hypothetical protein